MTTMNENRDFGSEFLELILEYIGENFVPEDVFSEKQLSQWAEDNGYVKEID